MKRLSKRKLAEIQRDKESNHQLDKWFVRVNTQRNRRRDENNVPDENSQESNSSQNPHPVHRRRENDENAVPKDEHNSLKQVSSLQTLAPVNNTHRVGVLSSLDNTATIPLQHVTETSSKGSKGMPYSRTENDEITVPPTSKRRIAADNASAEVTLTLPFQNENSRKENNENAEPLSIRRRENDDVDLRPPSSLQNGYSKLQPFQTIYGPTSGGIYSTAPKAVRTQSSRSSGSSFDSDPDDDSDDLSAFITKTKPTTINYEPVLMTEKDLIEDNEEEASSSSRTNSSSEGPSLLNRKAHSALPTVHYDSEDSKSKDASFFDVDKTDEENEDENASSLFVDSDAEFSIADNHTMANSSSLQELRPQQLRRPTLSIIKGSSNTLMTDQTLSPAEPETVSQVHVPLANPRGNNVLEKLGLKKIEDDDHEQDSQEIKNLEVGNTSDDDELPLDF